MEIKLTDLGTSSREHQCCVKPTPKSWIPPIIIFETDVRDTFYVGADTFCTVMVWVHFHQFFLETFSRAPNMSVRGDDEQCHSLCTKLKLRLLFLPLLETWLLTSHPNYISESKVFHPLQVNKTRVQQICTLNMKPANFEEIRSSTLGACTALRLQREVPPEVSLSLSLYT